MVRSIYVVALVAGMALVGILPTASANCSYTEVIGAGDDASVGVGQCEMQETYTYSGNGVLGDPTCVPVQPVRVLGQQVPGTGAMYCTPDQAVVPPSQSQEITSVEVCVNEAPPCAVWTPVFSPQCIAYAALRYVEDDFRCVVYYK